MKIPTLFIVVGAILLLGGILALANPFAASLAVTTLVGIFFLLAGIGLLWGAWQVPEDEHRLWNGLLGLVMLILGVMLTANPLAGTLSLTLIVGVLFFLGGVARLVIAFRLQGGPYFWPLLLAGALSVLIGFLVLGDIATAATSLLGLLLGIQLLFEGTALIVLGLRARQL